MSLELDTFLCILTVFPTLSVLLTKTRPTKRHCITPALLVKQSATCLFKVWEVVKPKEWPNQLFIVFTTSQTLNKQVALCLTKSAGVIQCLLVGRVLVSRTDNVGKTVSIQRKVSNSKLIQKPKRCCFIKTAARWTWKSSISKACVTTQLPNKLALKIDDAKA